MMPLIPLLPGHKVDSISGDGGIILGRLYAWHVGPFRNTTTATTPKSSTRSSLLTRRSPATLRIDRQHSARDRRPADYICGLNTHIVVPYSV